MLSKLGRAGICLLCFFTFLFVVTIALPHVVWGDDLTSPVIAAPVEGAVCDPVALSAKWNSVPGASYYKVALLDLSSGTLLIDNQYTYGTGYTISSDKLTPGHSYKLSVASVYGDVVKWSEVSFSVKNNEESIALSNASINGAILKLIYTEALDAASIPAASNFMVKVNGAAQETPKNVKIAGSTVTLTLSAAVKPEDIVTVSYIPGSNPVKSMSGSNAPAFTSQPVENITNNDTSLGAEVNGSILSLVFGAGLDTGSVPAPGDFTVTVNGVTKPAPASVNITGNSVNLTLVEAVQAGDTVVIGYIPGINPLRDPAGKNVPSFSNLTVENKTVVNRTSIYTYDHLKRLKTVKYGNGKVITYTYDDCGNILSVTVTD